MTTLPSEPVKYEGIVLSRIIEAEVTALYMAPPKDVLTPYSKALLDMPGMTDLFMELMKSELKVSRLERKLKAISAARDR